MIKMLIKFLPSSFKKDAKKLYKTLFFPSCKYTFSAIHLEICSKCNLSCTHCSRTIYDYESKNKNMDFGLYRKIIDEVKVYTRFDKPNLQLQGLGEPTLHPDFIRILSYARDSKKFRIISTTSNMLAVPIKKIDDYFSNGLNELVISLDSINPQTLNKIRKGTNAATLIANIKYAAEHYKDKIRFTTVVGKKNIWEIEDIADFLLSIQALKWILQPMQDMTGKRFFINRNDREYCNALLKEYKSSLQIQELNVRPAGRCNMPFQTLHVNCLGYVMPCCIWWDHNIINFGNVNEANVYTLFNSEKFNSFRNSLRSLEAQICKDCPSYSIIS